MGTVGLSFGSATSGTGFNVSSTVAEIVGNLQNVETPWKTQLTTLDSQDTAISSLGTLFSNLSNDMSSLTDAQGILAEKEGSSSNTNVLTLTAADSSAVAGTHTVEVTNLAATSSGYLSAVSSSSATLSGSITLKVGNGTAQTFGTTTDNTLSTLAAAINASSVGVDASVLTDSSGSRLSLVSGTSGADGNLTISSNSIAASNKVLGYTGTAGTTGVASTGTMDPVGSSSDTLTGSISVTVGSGTKETVVLGDEPSSGAAANTIYTGTSVNTLSTLESTIQSNSTSLGITASTNTAGTILTLTSGTTGTAGTLTVSSSVVDTGSSTLDYTNSVTGEDANLTVDGVALTSASNTVADLIPGVTFQLLAPSTKESDGSLEQVQVVITNYNTDVESTVSQFVSDYNSLVSAMSAQDGNDSSGNPEPLYGSPTLTLLQQQLMSGLNASNPNGSLTAISSNTGTTLTGSISIAKAGGYTLEYTGTAGTDADSTTGASAVAATGTLTAVGNSSDTLTGSISITVGSGTAETVVLGDEPSSGAATDTIYTGTRVNTLSTLESTIQSNSTSLGITASLNTAGTILSLTSGTAGSGGDLTVTSSISDTSAQTVNVPTTSGQNTLAGLASAINSAGIGVTATVVTSDNESTLELTSGTEGSSGALTVSSTVVATSDTLLSSTVTDGSDANTSSGTSATASTATLDSVTEGDALTGSISIKVGNGTTQTISVPANSTTSPSNNLSGVAGAINSANIGVTASVTTTNGKSTLTLTSGTTGTAGDLTVTSNILDTSNTSTTNLDYTNSSDIGSVTTLGISVNNDGTISLDTASLDSVLNADYNSVVGFFQNANSWGMSFSNMLSNAGNSTPTGILALAASSDSNIESTLNADISKENSLISAQQVSLTAELNSANEIMQELPSQLAGVNELYSAITGYNQNSGG
jgi:flagellar hook-associated protein 2